MLGLLLINLGTPEAPEPEPVKRYLRQFLNDDRVLDINPAARAALLNLVILRKRPKESAAAYKQVWTERGSPLLFHTKDLAKGVAEKLGSGEWMVEIGMRYGEPSIRSALSRLRRAGIDDLVIFPLYPQYASSSTGTALEEVYKTCATEWNVARLHVVPPFYDEAGYIDCFAENIRTARADLGADHILFSYHGLPERHVQKSDDSGAHCLASDSCCDRITEVNRNCYRAQCYATTRALSSKLELSNDDHSVSFQSRLGKDPWIQPFTDEVLPALAKRGVKKLVVACPSFVADCLETLEEIAIRAKDQFCSEGGENLALVPSLNSAQTWTDVVTRMSRTAIAPRSKANS